MPPKKIVKKQTNSEKTGSVETKSTHSPVDIIDSEIWTLKTYNDFVSSFEGNNLSTQEIFNLDKFKSSDTYLKYFELLFKENFYLPIINIFKNGSVQEKEEYSSIFSIIKDIYLEALKLLFVNNSMSILSNFKTSFGLKINKMKNKIKELNNDSEYLLFFSEIFLSFETYDTRNTKNKHVSSSRSINLDKFIESISSGKFGNPSVSIEPLFKEGVSTFLEYCTQIGRKLDTGSLLLTPEVMIDNYKYAVSVHMENFDKKSPSFMELFLTDLYIEPSVDMSVTDFINHLTLDKFEKLKLRYKSIRILNYFVSNLLQNKNTTFNERSGSKTMENSFSKLKKKIVPSEVFVEDVEKFLSDDEVVFFKSPGNYTLLLNIFNETLTLNLEMSSDIINVGSKMLSLKKQIFEEQNRKVKDNLEIIDEFFKLKDLTEFEDIFTNKIFVQLKRENTFSDISVFNQETQKECSPGKFLHPLIPIFSDQEPEYNIDSTVSISYKGFDYEYSSKYHKFIMESRRLVKEFDKLQSYKFEDEKFVHNLIIDRHFFSYNKIFKCLLERNLPEGGVNERFEDFFSGNIDKCYQEIKATVSATTETTVEIEEESVSATAKEEIKIEDLETLYKQYIMLCPMYKSYIKDNISSYTYEFGIYINNIELDKSIVNSLEQMFYYSSEVPKSITVSGKNKDKSTKSIRDNYILKYELVTKTEEDSNFKLYFWQREALEKATMGKSFFVWGDTSGGKTHVMILIIIMMIVKFPNVCFIYCCPTDQLAIQTFSNVFCTIGDKASILCECITYIKPSSSIIVGTPKEINDYLQKYNDDVFRQELPIEETITKIVSRRKTGNIIKLAIDEIHYMDGSYSGEGQDKKSRAIKSIIEGLRNNSQKDNLQLMALSASLNEESFNNCKRIVSEASGIVDIELVKYTKATSKLYERPLIEPNPINNQEIKELQYDGSEISFYDVSNPVRQESINIDMKFLLKLFYVSIKEKRDPMACFFKDEFTAISKFISLIDYFESINSQSRWYAAKTEYFRRLETDEQFSRLKIIIFLAKYISNISREIIFLDSSEYEQLINKYNDIIKNRDIKDVSKVSRDNFGIDKLTLIREVIAIESNSAIFTSPVHPYLNFGNIESVSGKLDVMINGEATNFGILLQNQNIDISKQNKLVKSLLTGLKYGVGLVTGSIPLGFQVEISKLLMELKNSSKSGIKFVICDDSLSVGVDYPLSSVALINLERESMLLSQFKQKSGRAGRNDLQGNYMDSTVYCINIEDASTIKERDDILTFKFEENSMYYYKPNEIYSCTREIVDTIIRITSSSGSGEVKTIINCDVINSFGDNCFPGISEIEDSNSKNIHVKMCLMELFYILRIIAPELALKYIRPLFLGIQSKIFDTIISVA